jgi:Putative Flp pilus-assembly TadE/G-like
MAHMFLSAIHRLREDERGSVTFLVALAIPTLFLVAILAVDVGNWYVHKRELQTQADAGALAAAAFYKYPCDDAPIRAEAEKYAGGQLNNFSNVPSARRVFLLNAPDFSGQSTPNDTELTGSPCADGAVDVKMTEHNVPWFFGKSLVPNINAQARVNIQRADSLAGVLPIALPVPDPKRVRVTFVSEVTGETLGEKDLCPRSDSNSSVQYWDNSATNTAGFNTTKGSCETDTAPSALPLTFNDSKYARVGVRLALSGSASTVSCNQPLVSCYDLGSSNGLAFIRGWSAEPAVAATGAPVARSVFLTPGTCGDAYFNSGSACTVGVSAHVDFQSPTPTGRKVTATVAGTTTDLVNTAGTNLWTATGLSIPAASGPQDVTLKWEQQSGTVDTDTCSTNGGNKCKGTITNAPQQRTFSAVAGRSGPISSLTVGDQFSTTGANDIERCSASNPTCTHNFVVSIGIPGTLALAKPGDPPTVLRVGGGGSQNQSIDCDPAVSQLKDEIATGCAPEYHRNTGQTCPSPSVFGTPTPWYCVGTQTGASVNQVSAGMNHRVLGSEQPTACTSPNNWPNWVEGDPRIVSLFIVPYGAFQGSGNQTFPVQDFASFYVTGWTGQGGGFNNPCQGNGDDPVPGNDPGTIVGHFIKPIEVPNNGGGGDQTCDLTSTSVCIAVLTR